MKFWSALCNEVKFNSLFYQNLKFLFKIWSKLNSPQIFLAPLILRTNFMLRILKLDKKHKRAIVAFYLSYKLLLMTFVTGPLICPLGRHKWRTSLRESAFRLRESTNFYGSFIQITLRLLHILHTELKGKIESTFSFIWAFNVFLVAISICSMGKEKKCGFKLWT